MKLGLLETALPNSGVCRYIDDQNPVARARRVVLRIEKIIDRIDTFPYMAHVAELPHTGLSRAPLFRPRILYGRD